ncbi:cytochrome oxidase [Myxococcus stipitatus DSM 14675]|uniref:Cytochrome oxidase n=1 Tax=Myxococcus stipitatus (strain DSM 14675 / JCM 12634 / Mx s8) TaxID=1278073 RepID=L7UAE9_MYXSD|nr:c-type cytochrome [Myxococcus stipitatus]AGC43409.1 cytochrome oxidase [Myxococcus stipitatus DSM 14675]
MDLRSPVFTFLVGAAILVATGAGAFVLVRDADILALRLPTKPLAPTKHALETPRDAVEHFQCNRCHVVPGIEPASATLSANCVTCHQAITAGRLDLWYKDAEVQRWKEHLTHLMRTPDLASLGQRVKRSWLVSWLQAPHAVRPLYGATMPRMKLGPRDAELLADFFHVTEEDAHEPPSGDAAAGRQLYEKYACATCHFRADAPPEAPAYGSPEFRTAPARRRAPDLKHVRARMSLAQLRQWLRDPRAILPDTQMPAFAFTPKEVDDLAAFLREPIPQKATAPRAPYKPRLLEREVHYPEVAKKLTRHLCYHCHSDSRRAGDQGPGNSGGFGYAGVSLDLATREGILRGIQREGQFRGLPDRLEDGTPRLVASLIARRAELEGHHHPAVLGMPLGLPPIPDEDIDLISTWIEQGAPR